MKRAGRLWDQICEPENLRLAFWKAAKGKWHRTAVRNYAANLEAEMAALRTGLLDGNYPVGRSTAFKIFDPKERTIHAAAFPERVVHHALMNACEPVFERALIADTYACRRGKGRLAAIARAQAHAARHPWFLKLDVRKYFESIDHAVLLTLLGRRLKERPLLAWFARIVRSHAAGTGRGLPIGSLTSQHLANAYLGRLDRFVTEELRVGAYVRYMDDFVLWTDNKAELLAARAAVREFLRGELKLELKRETSPQRSAHGMDFLGTRVFPRGLRLARRGRRRFTRNLRDLERRRSAGLLGESELQVRMTALLAALTPGDCVAWRRRVLKSWETDQRARNALTAAAATTTTPATAAPPTATRMSPATATTTWVSGSLSRPSSAPSPGGPEADPVRLPLVSSAMLTTRQTQCTRRPVLVGGRVERPRRTLRAA